MARIKKFLLVSVTLLFMAIVGALLSVAAVIAALITGTVFIRAAAVRPVPDKIEPLPKKKEPFSAAEKHLNHACTEAYRRMN